MGTLLRSLKGFFFTPTEWKQTGCLKNAVCLWKKTLLTCWKHHCLASNCVTGLKQKPSAIMWTDPHWLWPKETNCAWDGNEMRPVRRHMTWTLDEDNLANVNCFEQLLIDCCVASPVLLPQIWDSKKGKRWWAERRNISGWFVRFWLVRNEDRRAMPLLWTAWKGSAVPNFFHSTFNVMLVEVVHQYWCELSGWQISAGNWTPV